MANKDVRIKKPQDGYNPETETGHLSS